MSRFLVLLSGYPCARSPWGNSQDHGIPDLSEFNSFYAGAEYLKKLFIGADVDYICTTWDDVGEDLIRRTYKPIAYGSYSQNKFLGDIYETLNYYELERIKRRNKYYSDHGLTNNLVVSSVRFASQLKSRCSAAELALGLIDKKRDSYDAILLTRYDISSRGGFLVRHPTFLRGSDFSFLASSCDHPRFIIPSFSQLNCGFPDMWLYMNQAGLKHYSKILENYTGDITSSSSEYFKMMTEGWPFSRKFIMHSIYDYRQYSNEIFRSRVGSQLMSYPDWEVSNLHSYHKYYLRLSGVLPPGESVRFKGRFDVLKAFWANSNFSTKVKSFFLEGVAHLTFSLRILLSRFSLRE